MRRIAVILFTLLAAIFSAAGQNNAYAIDDECFYWFAIAERTVDDFDSDEFEQAQRNLLELSLRRKDTKAQTLYYIDQLKHTSHYAQYLRKANKRDNVEWDAVYWNARIEEERETAQRIAKATGYLQYYYYAADMCQTYYFNTGQDAIAGEMFSAMMQEAQETEDEYAMWKCLSYLSTLYKRIGDQWNTQRYLLEAVQIYENTSDETILRQSMTTQYSDLACTYPVGSDSARMYYNKAELTSMTQQDTIRMAYYKAQLAAWDGNQPEYRRNRDYCLAKPNFTKVITAGDHLFKCVDNMLRGSRADAFIGSIDSLYLHQQLYYVSYLGAKLEQWQAAAAALFRFEQRLSGDITSINRQRLEQMSAEYGNKKLQSDLAEASRKVTRTTIWIAILTAMLLLAGLAFSLLHIRTLKKAYDKDEARIAELEHELQ